MTIDGCQACPTSTPFYYQGPGMVLSDFDYLSPTVSASATSAADCVAQYGQLVGSAAAPLTATGGVTELARSVASSLVACASACTARADCQYLVYDYANFSSPCQIRLSGPARPAADNKWVGCLSVQQRQPS
jgi:hypothetical protein